MQRRRHRTEEVLQAVGGEAGLDHYEVRSRVVRRHRVTRSRAAPVVLVPGAASRGENPGGVGAAMRRIFTRPPRSPAPAAEEIAEVVTRILRRNEGPRSYELNAWAFVTASVKLLSPA